ncbi:hypothetical protein CPB85DRAFT_1430031 [Mucidula mucida]|nr:hypothetical protein CPB85DRAFT_1430031 [Mucidula mucida]
MSSKADTNRQPSRRPSAKPSLTLSAPSGNGRSLVTDGTPSPTTRKHITNAHKQTPSQPMQSQPDDDISGPLPAARPPAMSTRARALSSPSTPTKVRRPATAPSLAAPTSSSRGLPSPIGPRSKAAQGTGSPMSSGPRKHSSSRNQEEERPRTAEPNFVDASNSTSHTTSRNRRSPESVSKSMPAPSASSAATAKYPGQLSTQNTFSSARRAPTISEQSNTSGPLKPESSHNSTATASSLKSASPSPSHTRPPLISSSQKSSSPIRTGMPSIPLRPTLSTESFPPHPKHQALSAGAGEIEGSRSRDLFDRGPSSTKTPNTVSPLSAPPSGSLSAPSTSQFRSSPTPQRTASTSLSSATSISRRNLSDSARGKAVSTSPALDSLPQRLAIDDMKRLLSKPASILSASDSEGYRSMGHVSNNRRKTTVGGVVSSDDDMGGGGYRSSPGRMSNAFAIDRLPVTDSGLNSDAEDDHPLVGSTLPLPTTVKRSPSADKRQRNVLRRRPSSGNKSTNLAIFPASYTEAKLKATGASSSKTYWEWPDTSERLIIAYKQQQEEKDKKSSGETERIGNSSPAASIKAATQSSSSLPATEAPPPVSEDATTPPSTPYYTVFGSKSGKVVAVGGPEDAWSELSIGSGFVAGLGAGLGLDLHERTASVTVGKPRLPPKPSSSSGLGKTLSRKMSGRWRKGSMAADDIEWERERDRDQGIEQEERGGEERGRMSLQERRGQHRKSSVKGEEAAKELRVSIEKHAMPFENSTPLKTPITGSLLSTPKLDDSLGNSPSSGSGSKLWKLMKRISTGGLRDRYVDESPTEPPPPVPPIPKDYLEKTRGPKSIDGYGSHNPGLLSKFAQTRSSLSAPRPSLSTVTVRPTTVVSSTSSGVTRPSTTTRSSSPVSSDVASSKFFNRTQSQRSSTSSYGDEVPPMPNTVLGQNIVPPNELYKLTMRVSMEGERAAKTGHRTRRSTSSPEKWIRPSGMGIEPPTLPSLPVPPTQRLRKPSKDRNQAPSPTIPAFSTNAPINTFPSRKSTSASLPDVDTKKAMSPPAPPRPSRSPHRPSPSSSTSTSRVTSPIPPSSRPPLPDSAAGTMSLDLRRTSTASHATARPKSYASTFGPTSTPVQAQFRDKPVPKLGRTEQEKADMWDDLLERSARAGGTIHLKGGDGLASDQLRFSGVSADPDDTD